MTVTASVVGTGVDLDVKSARLELDEQWRPYAQMTLTAGITDEADLDAMDPSERPRVAGWLQAGSTGRRFDMLVRTMEYDAGAGSVTLGLASDEALLQDAALVSAGPWTPTQPSARFVVAYVLASIGAVLEDELDDGVIDPASSVWLPGVTASSYLAPILTATGLRLYCTEQRHWHLKDSDASTDGFVTLDPAVNVVRETSSASMDDPQGFYDAVVVQYAWTAADGTRRTSYDTAGTSSGYFDLSGVGNAPLQASFTLSRNAVMQSAVQSPDTGEWYVVQVIAGTNGSTSPYETTVINRLTPAGAFIDAMILDDGGHGTSIGVEYSGGRIYIWHAWAAPGPAGTLHDLVRFPYARGEYVRSEVPGLTVMPRFGTARVLPSFDWASDLVVYRVTSGGTEWYTKRNISDVLANVNRPRGMVQLPTAPPTMQGFVIAGDALIEYTGTVNEPAGDTALVSEYAFSDGRLIDQRSTAKLGRNADGSYPGNRHEPESAQLYRDPSTGDPYLDLGVTLNVSGSYVWKVYRYPLPNLVNAKATRVLALDYETPPPAAGAAARILRRRLAYQAARSVDAVSDLNVTPTQTATLRGRTTLSGAVSAVSFDFPDGTMSVRTRDLVASGRYGWLNTAPGLAWTEVAAGTPWTDFDPAAGGAIPTSWLRAFPAGTSWLNSQPAGVSWNRLGNAPLQTWSAAPTGATWASLPAGVAWNKL